VLNERGRKYINIDGSVDTMRRHVELTGPIPDFVSLRRVTP